MMFQTEAELEEALGLPVLGFIPRVEEPDQRLISEDHLFSPLLESFRVLRTNLRFMTEQPLRSLTVTSSMPKEGKSLLLRNLALAMALDGKRVLLVDADLRRPIQHAIFACDGSPGLVDSIIGTHDLPEVIRPTHFDNVDLLAAGSPPPIPTELLGSERMRQLLPLLESRYDIVLFDTSPLRIVPDGLLLASQTMGTLLVVAQNETSSVDVAQSLKLLRRSKSNVLGSVFNFVKSSE